MAFTYVTATANRAAFTTSTAPTCAYLSTPSANSLLVALVFVDHATTTPSRTVSSITDTRGNAWSQVVAGTLSTTQFLNAEIWYCQANAASGANTVTVNLSGAATAGVIFVAEYSLTNGAGATANASMGETLTTNNATSFAIGPTTTSAAAGDLVLALCGLHNTTALTIANSSGYTNRSQYTSTTANASWFELLNATAATQSCTATFTAHRYEAGAIATFTENPPRVNSVAGAVAATSFQAPAGNALHGYPALVAQDGAYNYYRTDETTGTSVVDLLGHGGGTYFGTPTLNQAGALTDSGDSNAAVALSGASQYLTVPRQIANDFTVEFWFASTSGAGINNTDMWQGQGLIQERTTGGTADWGITLGADGKVVYGTYDGVDHACVSGAGYNDGFWHHVVATRVQSTGAMALVIDGSVVATQTGATIALSSTATINIGRTPIELVYLVGSLDEIAFYTSALTATQARAHYLAAAFGKPTPTTRSSTYYTTIRAETGLSNYYSLDDTGSAVADNFGPAHGVHYVGTTSGAQTHVTGALVGDTNTALSFNGTSEQVHIPRQISADFSVEFWLKSTSGLGTGNTLPFQGQTLVASRIPGGQADWGISLGADGIIVAGAFGGSWAQCVSGTGWNDGAWHHLVFTRTQSTGAMSLYIDSVLQSSATGTTIALDSTSYITVGNNVIDHPYYNGSLDELAIYTVALTQAQVTSHYNTGAPASQTIAGPTGSLIDTALNGSVAVTLAGPAASQSEAASAGSLAFRAVGQTASATESAPQGTLQTRLTGQQSNLSLTAPSGSFALAATGQVSSASYSAPPGSTAVALAGVSVSHSLSASAGAPAVQVAGLTTGETTQALSGLVGVDKLYGLTSAVTYSSPVGGLATSATANTASHSLTAPTGQAHIQPAGDVAGYSLSAPAGAVAITTNVVTGTTVDVGVTAPQGAFGEAVTGQLVDYSIAAPSGSLALSFSANTASLTQSASAGSFAYTAQGALADYALAAPSGSLALALTGETPSVIETPLVGSFAITLTGQSAGFTQSAPQGFADAAQVLAGPVAALTLAAPQGIAGVDRVYGQTASLTLASQGSVELTLAGQASDLASQAQAGSLELTATAPASDLSTGALTGSLSFVLEAPTVGIDFEAPAGTEGTGLTLEGATASLDWFADANVLIASAPDLSTQALAGQTHSALQGETGALSVIAFVGSWHTEAVGQPAQLTQSAVDGVAHAGLTVIGETADLSAQAAASFEVALTGVLASYSLASPDASTDVAVRLYPIYKPETFATKYVLQTVGLQGFYEPESLKPWQPTLVGTRAEATLVLRWEADLVGSSASQSRAVRR